MYSNTKLYQELNKGNIEKTKEMLLDNIREESSSKNGTKKPFTVVQNMFKKLDKADFERFGNKAIPMKDGRFGFIDGHRVFIADSDLGYTDRADFKLEQALQSVNDFDREVEIDVTELKKFIAVVKAEKRNKWESPKPYIIEMADGYMIGANPNFLKDAIDYSGITKIRFVKSYGNIQKTPLYFIDNENNIIAVVLPVYINQEESQVTQKVS